MKFKKFLAILIAITCSVAMFGCKKASNIDKPEEEENAVQVSYEPEYGGELKVPISNVKTLNPLVNQEKSLYHFYKLIYEPMFEFDKNFNVQNKLCKSYSIKDDGRTIVISLRDDVLWHDGKKLSAKDVKFTIDALRLSAKEGLYADLFKDVFKVVKTTDLKQIIQAKVINDSTVEIKLNRSYSNALESLMFPILPMHQFTDSDSASRKDLDKAFNPNYIQTPIGTGPYKFVKHEKLKSIQLVANDSYYKGKPYINSIKGLIVDTDETALSSFETELIDVAFAMGTDWDKYLENSKFNIYNYSTNKYEFVGFNFSKPIFQGNEGLYVRNAISLAINRKDIVNKVFLNHAEVASTPVNPNSWLFDGEVKSEFDPDKARELLAQAGYKDTNEDGILEKANGQNLRIRLLTNSYNELRAGMADIVIEDLKEVGIEVIKDYADIANSKEEDIAQQWNELNDKVAKGQFDMVLLGWDLSLVPEYSFMLHSSQIDNGTNFIRFADQKMDELLVGAFSAQSREAKKQAYKELQDYFVKQIPYTSLVFKNKALLVNDRVKGDVKPQAYNVYENVEKWFIPKEFQVKTSN